ncbi:MAG TPA: hypothetical protein PLC97_11390 [Myxococcota bacterium]|nr:hypothetical protein [Myxococcota bacterium]
MVKRTGSGALQLGIVLLASSFMACSTTSTQKDITLDDILRDSDDDASEVTLDAILSCIPSPSAKPEIGPNPYVFFMGKGCKRTTKWYARNVHVCEGDKRILLDFNEKGEVQILKTTDAPPRKKYPGELVHQWRYCPFAVDSRLEALPLLFAKYEDPDVGLCYIYRPTDQEMVDQVYGPARLKMLKSLHPVLADATQQLVIRAKKLGIEIKVISGVRPHTAGTKKGVVRDKDGKRSKKTKTVKKVGLHSFGLAVDVNLMHHKGLTSARKAYEAGGREKKAWDTVGRLGEELGLLWLGPIQTTEIFHFEWRPTLSGRPKGDELQKLLRAQKKGGNQAVWELLRYNPKQSSAFKDLKDPKP